MDVDRIIVVGGSAGGIEAAKTLVAGLPPHLPAAMFLVIHLSPEFPSALPSILGRAGPLSARHPTDGEAIEPNCLYVAPPNCHLLVEAGRVRLSSGPRENRHRPAIDCLFRSAARAYGDRVMAVVLSGSQNDGTAGLMTVKRHGGVAIVQEPESATCRAMPQSAIEHVAVDHVVAPEAMAPLLVGLLSRTVRPQAGASDPMTEHSPIPTEDAAEQDRRQQPGLPSTQTCPECHGTLWEVHEGDLLEFRCRVCHAYTAEALAAHQAEQLEVALWTALRALEEHQALVRRLAERATRSGRPHGAASFTEQAVDAEHNASIVRGVLRSHGVPRALVSAEPRRRSG